MTILPYLTRDAIRDIVLGRGAIGKQNAARLLREIIASGRDDKALTPLVRQIEKAAVRTAAQKVINRHGRINRTSRFAQDLLPGLTDLSVLELIRLKLVRAWKGFLSRLGR